MSRLKFGALNWIMSIAVVAIAGGVLLHAQSNQVSTEDARKYLKSGAQVVDVRTPAEYAAGHLPKAINVPLQLIESGASLPLVDKKQILLLHCQSGVRSAKATKLLTSKGYANVFDLGSYSKATQIVGAE
jgi:rhodanese-related sulfurtransferase